MPKRFKKGLTAPVRGTVRSLVIAGRTRTQIVDAVEERYGLGATRKLTDMIRQEEKRQSAVANIQARDKRNRVNLGELVGCTDPNIPITTHMTIHWVDAETGATHKFWYVTTLDRQGRLADILNKALTEVTEYARHKGYSPPSITSAAKGGKAYYRLEYVECV